MEPLPQIKNILFELSESEKYLFKLEDINYRFYISKQYSNILENTRPINIILVIVIFWHE